MGLMFNNTKVTKKPIYPGWLVMVAGTFGIILSSPGQTYSVSLFLEHIIKDLSLSHSLVSTLYSIATLTGSLTLPLYGKLIDQNGPRKIVIIVSTLFGLSCIFMGLIQNALMLGVGFIMIRMLGLGSLGLISQTMINQWWIKKRGLINGISGLLIAIFGIGGFPFLLNILISSFGWRISFIIQGIGVILLMIPIGFYWYLDRPEKYGLHPDGIYLRQKYDPLEQKSNTCNEEHWTLQEAIHTAAFWILGITLATFNFFANGMMFHLVTLFNERGFGITIAASVFIPLAISAAVVNLVGGFLADHIPHRLLLILGLCLQIGYLILSLSLQNGFSIFIFGLLIGSTIGLARTVSIVIWPAFFGREQIGSIYGLSMALCIIGSALGPLPMGFFYDQKGTYNPILYVSVIAAIVFCLLAFVIQKPKKALYFQIS